MGKAVRGFSLKPATALMNWILHSGKIGNNYFITFTTPLMIKMA